MGVSIHETRGRERRRYRSICANAGDTRVSSRGLRSHLAGMNTALAIYDALLQAGVAEAPARRVVESLEQDMTSLLATKQDFLLVRQELEALRQQFRHLEDLTSARIEALGGKLSLHLQNIELRLQASESRVVIRLSAVMAGLVALAGTLLAILR